MKNYKLHLLKTKRHRKISLSIMFRNYIDKDNYTKKALLFELMTYTSEKYRKLKDLVIECENLYNAYSNDSFNKTGVIASYEMFIDFTNPKYTNEDFLERALKVPFDILLHPRFDEEELEKTKIKFKKYLENKSLNPTHDFWDSFYKELDDTTSRIDIEGDPKKIDEITIEDLKEEYNKLKDDVIDIYVTGNFDKKRVKEIIEKYATFDNKYFKLDVTVNHPTRDKAKVVEKKSNNKQTLIAYAYNLVEPTEFERKYVFNLYLDILGGNGCNNKLFHIVREKNSLCYSIDANGSCFNKLMIIFTKIDKKNINKCTKLIEEIVDTFKETVTEEELEITKQNIANGFKCSDDSISGVVSEEIKKEYIFNATKEERLENYLKVTLDDVKKLSDKIKINMKYIQRGDGNEED